MGKCGTKPGVLRPFGTTGGGTAAECRSRLAANVAMESII
jgi:hypothetical protein